MPNYANIVNSTQTGKSGGYKPALYFSEVSDITNFARPIPSPVALGDKVKIVSAHTWAPGKAVNKWGCKLHSVKHTSAPIGDEGSQDFEHSAEVVVLGDNAATFEQMCNMLNDEKVIWLKDADCLTNDSYIQLGDDCVPVTASPNFDGFTTKEGQKAYTITFKSKKKFFYLAALDETV